jgi:hypothetical protein
VKPHYSGETSVQFWERIRAIKDPASRDVVYLFGCALQDLEDRMFQALNKAEANALSNNIEAK